MRGSVIFLLMLVGIASFSFAALSANSEKTENTKLLEFITFTSAVCEAKEEVIHCKDEVFVNCNGNISKAADVAECDGIRIDVPKVDGFAVFDRGWKDPRN